MTNRGLGQAVEAYRKRQRIEMKLALIDHELTRFVATLDSDDFDAYVRLTQEIDAAAETAEGELDAYRGGQIARSTLEQRISTLFNGAGRS